MRRSWVVLTLVVALVFASMGVALAEESVEPEAQPEVPEAGSYTAEWVDDLVTFVFFWGMDEPPECEPSEPDPGGGIFLPPPDPGEVESDCLFLNVEGPNGQVNHGSMVSSFVHWLKGEGSEMLSDELLDMPKGQLVKHMAHQDFGKGFFELDDEDGLDLAEAEDDEGKGPPDWVKEKKEAKVKGKEK